MQTLDLPGKPIANTSACDKTLSMYDYCFIKSRRKYVWIQSFLFTTTLKISIKQKNLSFTHQNTFCQESLVGLGNEKYLASESYLFGLNSTNVDIFRFYIHPIELKSFVSFPGMMWSWNKAWWDNIKTLARLQYVYHYWVVI